MNWRKREEAAVAVTHWDVISHLMQIDPPPAMGDSWLDGVHDGVYQAQCYLKGRAQGQAMNGDYSAAVETAKIAVALNAQRSVTPPPTAHRAEREAHTTAYFDIKWETVEKPVRRGYTFEEYWLRNCEPTATPPTTQPRTPAGSTEEATS